MIFFLQTTVRHCERMRVAWHDAALFTLFIVKQEKQVSVVNMILIIFYLQPT